MKIINTEFNVGFARAMAEHNRIDIAKYPGENKSYINNPARHSVKIPGLLHEPKTSIIARAAYSKAMHERIENMRNG
jgi:hypothetical protein